jgi:hypothetical protein
MPSLLLLASVACHGPDGESDSDVVPDVPTWSHQLPELVDATPAVRGLVPTRAIIHLHSPWSHDACDGDGLIDGVTPNPECLADLRTGLCATHVDAAFVTDHPDFSAFQVWDDLFMQQPGDAWIDVDGQHRANLITCDDGHQVTWMPGVEDELMPVSLDRQPSDDVDENHAILNDYTVEALQAERDAGALVLTAHTEQRDLADLTRLQDGGLTGTELFNLHAMFAPDIREEYLGLDPISWLADVAPFTSPTGTAEPDLLVLGVLQEQDPSIERWDALLARGPMVGTAGTDAHQNVLPLDLRDGERGDSYRRMLSWFSNVLLVDGTGPEADQDALAAGRLYVAFEVLGVPSGLDFHAEDTTGGVAEIGGTVAQGGTLVVTCPTVSALSPHGAQDPEISVTIFKDGAAWQTGCGRYPAFSGVYRVRFDIVPWHLREFLGDEPDVWLHSYPWIYTNAIRVQ